MNKGIIIRELKFKAIRSSGSGGQHVNKVSSKVELQFNLGTSEGFTESERNLLHIKLLPKFTNEGLLILTCQESRSQHRNKELVIERFFNLISKSLIIPKVRKKTRPSKLARQKRLDAKKRLSEKKSTRKKFRF